MQWDTVPLADGRQRGDVLRHAGLVIHVQQRDQSRFRAQRALEHQRVQQAIGAGLQFRRGNAAHWPAPAPVRALICVRSQA